MNPHYQKVILAATGASALQEREVIQELWSGYGEILRVDLAEADYASVVVKHVQLEGSAVHPRGWDTDLSHQRKLRSYEVETAWYRRWAGRCDAACRVPVCLAVEPVDDEVLMVLEDLDASGFPSRRSSVSEQELLSCLNWLAHFHAVFMGESPDGLWPVGTYWHLETRPDEWRALNDPALKQAAAAIDMRLNQSPFQTFVHGDAKLANFCFSRDGSQVAAVDFQYVGGGCGMKDLAYFLGSCLSEEDCERLEEPLLDAYFSDLKSALRQRRPDVDGDAVEADWRSLYPVAWTDFHRFLQGWSPGHWKLNRYSNRLAREVVTALGQEKA